MNTYNVRSAVALNITLLSRKFCPGQHSLSVVSRIRDTAPPAPCKRSLPHPGACAYVTVQDKGVLADGTQAKTLRWESLLSCPSGPNLIRRDTRQRKNTFMGCEPLILRYLMMTIIENEHGVLLEYTRLCKQKCDLEHRQH